MIVAKKRELKNGAKNAKIEIAKKLLQQQVSIDVIKNATGLTKEEIEKIK